MQFFNNSYITYGPSICGGMCPSIKAQLVWLEAFEAIRNDKALSIAFGPNTPFDLGPRWVAFLDDARTITEGPFGKLNSFGVDDNGNPILK
jgi:hypothetical protein